MAQSAVTVVGKIVGIFTKESAERLFRAFDRALGGAATAQVSMIIDCRAMDDYTTEARAAFTEWMTSHRSSISKVAIVTPKTVWHMAIATMSLVSGIPMRGFPTMVEAETFVGPSSSRIDA